MKSTAETGSRRRFWTLFLCAAALALVYVLFVVKAPRQSGAPILQQRSRKQLELKDGRLYFVGKPFSGVVIDHYDGGELKSRSAVSNGLLQGLSEGWYTNGIKQVTEHFTNGVSSGMRVKYYATGEKQSEAQIVNGKIEGLFQRWYENGQLAEKVYLTDGVPNGESIAYHPDGSLKARARLDHGKVVEQQFWEPGQSAP